MPLSSIESPRAGRMPTPMTIEFNSGTCGSGKTRYICKLAASTPGRYVIAIDRREIAQARIDTIKQFALEAGTEPMIECIFGKDDNGVGVANVRRNIRFAGAGYSMHEHVIVIVTHEGLKTSDLTTYKDGWTLLIDEMLTIWTHGSLVSPAARLFLDQHYRLDESLDFRGYSTIRARSTSNVSTVDLHCDDLLCDLAVMDRRIRGGHVVANIIDWDATASRKQWSWWSVWSVLELAMFERVILAANAIETSVTYKMLKALYGEDELILKPFAIEPHHEVYRHRHLTISYFAANHTAGTTFFNTELGKRGLGSVIDWLSANISPSSDKAYWSGNRSLIARVDIPNVTKISPRAAGRNDLAAYTTCAMLYTSKPSPDETTALKMCEVSRDNVVRTRETEDIFQMLMRSSLRDPSNEAAVILYVYDKTQAQEQARLIAESGLAITVALEHINVGLDVEGKPKAGRPSHELTDDEQIEKILKIKAQDKARAQRRKALLSATKRVSV
jgi:hypothetical protein